MKLIAFVPAKGKSSRIPSKNSQQIGGLPLFLRACCNLNQIIPKDGIYVDSDDEGILELASANGFQVIRRPDDLATNRTDGNAFFRWETSQVPDADVYIQHLPPMPFLSQTTLETGLNAVIAEGFDSIVPVAERHSYLWDKETGAALYDLNSIPNSVDLPVLLEETMGLYIIRATAHRKTGLRIGENPFFLAMPVIEQMDIDYPEELEMARALESGLPEYSPYTSACLARNSQLKGCYGLG